jgi:hypothetical protein
MTATITPPANAPGLKRSDPSVRMKDYLEAFSFYLSLPDWAVDRVVLLENSDTDLTPFHEAAAREKGAKRVELIGFQGNDHDPNLGKGYGEFKMIDIGLDRSQLLRADSPIWKVTGRLQIRNLARLIQTAPLGYQMYCDLRYVPVFADRISGNRWMDLRVASWTMKGYDRYLRGRYPDLRNHVRPGGNIGPEDYLYASMREAMATLPDHGIVPRFRVQPIIEGFGGNHNLSYQSRNYKAKEVLRAVSRRVTPWLWL